MKVFNMFITAVCVIFGNLKLDFMAKSIGIHFFGFEHIFRRYGDTKT